MAATVSNNDASLNIMLSWISIGSLGWLVVTWPMELACGHVVAWVGQQYLTRVGIGVLGSGLVVAERWGWLWAWFPDPWSYILEDSGRLLMACCCGSPSCTNSKNGLAFWITWMRSQAAMTTPQQGRQPVKAT